MDKQNMNSGHSGPQLQQPYGYGQQQQQPTPPPPYEGGPGGYPYGYGGGGGYGMPPPGAQVELMVRQEPAPLNLSALVNLSYYTISSTGSTRSTSRMASDAQGHHLFSQNEVCISNNPYLVLGYLNFVDSTCYQFLKAELTNSGTRIMSGDLHLGTLEAMTPYSDSTVYASSAIGLGNVSLIPEEGCCTSCLCITACCGSVSKVSIQCNGQHIGEIVYENGRPAVTIQPNLDARVKALVVVGSFMMYNMFWK